ncbi:AAA-type ATPase family protein [Tasmannia lanceolata]|uniref:AAA-type ATPase family protein n=1 Tax=Tasmannia lanceolata TaxID=3420 RepID=UPI004063A4E3
MHEMEQLLNMGFPHELATKALSATGGKSTLKATEWILNNNNNNRPPSPSPSSPSPFQNRLDLYFHKNPSDPQNPKTQIPSSPPKSSSQAPLFKRPKPSPKSSPPSQPLSERMRPHTIDEVLGQDHLLAQNSVLRSALNLNHLPSIILWGPPGTGKTSIARALINSAPTSYRFVSLSAVTAGVKDVREVVDEARRLKKQSSTNGSVTRTVLFIDEVHRFNKSQQDSFLPVIEDGTVVFIGATTENPSFHLITPLLSRCRVLTLNRLQPTHVANLLERAGRDEDNGLGLGLNFRVRVNPDAIEFLSLHCEGDARVALNALEIAVTTAAARIANPQLNFVGGSDGTSIENSEIVAIVTLDDAKEALQCKHLAYDRAGEEHYNLISALHKSMRGSDPDAAIYWLVRMLEGGEEPLYIARRLVRFASEDVGLADPAALGHAVACYQACHFLGMPECNVNLAQCVAYLALAPKSVSVYRAMEMAQKVVRESVGQNEAVPLHLRNAPTKLMKGIGYGKGYVYTPDHPSSSQKYLPPSLEGYKFLDWPPLTSPDDKLFPFSQRN